MLWAAGCRPQPAGAPTSLPTSNPGSPLSTSLPTGDRTPAATPTFKPIPAATEVTPAAQQGGSRLDPSTHYTLTAVLNYTNHFLAVDQQIRYYNQTGEVLPELRLMVEPTNYPGAFRLTGLVMQEGPLLGELIWENGQVRLPMQEALQPGQTILISLSYEINLPSPAPSAETRPVPFGYTARQTNLVDWYPFIPPYRVGQGWLANKVWYFGEHLAYETANFSVSLRFVDQNPNLTVAASAAAKVDGEWRHYELKQARNFAISVSSQYQVTRQQVGSVEVVAYAFPIHPTAGQAVLDTTAKALELYTEMFGPYPHATLSVVEADFLDGMEYDGLYFLSKGFYDLYQGTPGEYLIAIAAHETAHQWFYALVGNDQGQEPWLDEALCTYSERLYFERYFPEALEWWWAYRVNYYQPRGPVDGSIYNPQGYRAYRDAVYLNGAVFLEELRSKIGDPVFFAFLQAYVEQNQRQIATGDDFFSTLAQFTQVPVDSLTKRFFLTH